MIAPSLPLDLVDIKAEIEQEKKLAQSGDNRIYKKPEHDRLLNEAKEQAHEEGAKEGYAKGRNDEKEDILAETAKNIENLSPILAGFLAEGTDHRARLEEQALSFAISVWEKISPQIVDQWGKDKMLGQVKDTLEKCFDKPQLKIYSSQGAAHELRDQIDALADKINYQGLVSVSGSPDIGRGEIKVEWDNGFLEYKLPEICAEIAAKMNEARNNLNSDTRGSHD